MPVLLIPRMLSQLLSHFLLFFNHQSMVSGIDDITLPTTAYNQGQQPAPENSRTMGDAFSNREKSGSLEHCIPVSASAPS